MSQIKLYPDVASMVKVMPRIETLYYFVYELAQCFHADQDTLASIKTGILDNQILERINIEYLNRTGEKIAELTIEIDWDKHYLLAKTEEGKNIQIDMSKSVVDNIVGWKKYALAHVDAVMSQFGAYSVNSTYTYRRQITRSETTHQQARDIMHHVPVTKPTPSAINPTLQNELSCTLQKATGKKIVGDAKKRSFNCGKLEEVSVEMTYKTKA